MIPKFQLFCATAFALTVSTTGARAAESVNVYLSSPYAQTASAAGYSGTTDSTFDTTVNTTYTTPYTVANFGTFTPASGGNFALDANGQYGGGGQGGYLAVPAAGGTTVVTLNNPVSFLGIEWCAIDSGNQLTLLDASGNTIGSFTAATINNYLTAHSTVTLSDGSTYANSLYKGQPNSDGASKSATNDPSENFGYVSFIANAGTTIKTIRISETGATFESDNWSILTNAPTPAGASVLIAVVPEPSVMALAGLAGGMALLLVARRRRAS